MASIPSAFDHRNVARDWIISKIGVWPRAYWGTVGKLLKGDKPFLRVKALYGISVGPTFFGFSRYEVVPETDEGMQ